MANARPGKLTLLCLISLIWMSLLFAGCGGKPTLAVYLRANTGDLARPHSVDSRVVSFVVEPGTPARAIGEQLVSAGLIGDALLFEAYVVTNNLAAQLEAGTFELAPSMTMLEIVAKLQNAQDPSITVTIPEGWRLEQVAAFLEETNLFGDAVDGISAQARRYAQLAGRGQLEPLDATRYPFLHQRPPDSTLEGYLFPDTYELPATSATAEDLLTRQLDAFAARVLPLYNAAQSTGATNLSLYEVLTLASIVEREAVVGAERPAIAGVYLNRLDVGMQLDADPTVQYAMGYQPATGQWWKTPVFLEEYAAVDSPYNTYLYPGLPPGPIAGPGLGSIQGVLAPENHDFLYFVALPDGSGAHVFARTFAEHQENVERYLRGR